MAARLGTSLDERVWRGHVFLAATGSHGHARGSLRAGWAGERVAMAHGICFNEVAGKRLLNANFITHSKILS